jgi:hypothetical protein
MEATMAPASWPSALYESERGVGLAVCVEHRGAHCWYLDRCVPIGGRTAMAIGPFRPCVLHEGRHLYVRGFCVSPGRRYAYRYGRCADDGCGVEVCNRLDVLSGRSEALDAGTDLPHRHLPPVRVELDEERLAAAIVAASRATRAERRATSTQTSPDSSDRPPAPPGSAPGIEAAAVAHTPIPTVTVWSPGPDDGAGT